MTDFKVGDKIKMKENCVGIGDGIKKGEICILHDYTRFPEDAEGLERNQLVAHGKNGDCTCIGRWLLLTNRGKNPRGKDGKFVKKAFSIICMACGGMGESPEKVIHAFGCGNSPYGQTLEERVQKLEEFNERLMKIINDLIA